VTQFAKACKELKDSGSNLIFISTVCGSLEDPQDTLKAEKMLRDAGVIVTKSNYESTKIASAFLAALEERG
ncbi:MAG: FdrA family protein, partial [Clostridia bacterium]|nr:FdrA family protein [Clostridia bacterium]